MKKQDLGSKDALDFFFIEKDMWLISKNSAITEKRITLSRGTSRGRVWKICIFCNENELGRWLINILETRVWNK
jgi:hypothetical protein